MSEMKTVTATKGVILHTHEVRRLLDAGEACIVRPMTPQPSEAAQWDVIHPSHTRKHPAPYLDSYCSAKKTDANPRGMSAHWCWWTPDDRQGGDWIKCPLGSPGDSRWVRETWQARVFTNHDGDAVDGVRIIYVADNAERWFHDEEIEADWAMPKNARKGNISGSAMPQWASRLTIATTAVACKRVQQITYHEVLAAGIKQASSVPYGNHEQDTIETFQEMWDRRHKKTPLANNPWVWVCAVKVSGK